MLEDLSIPVKQVFSCKVKVVKDSLDKADADILEKAINNPEWPLTTLARELQKRNINVSDNTLRRHRMKACSCWKI